MKLYRFKTELNHSGIHYKAGTLVPATDADVEEFERIGGIFVCDDGSAEVVKDEPKAEEVAKEEVVPEAKPKGRPKGSANKSSTARKTPAKKSTSKEAR